MNAPTMGEMNGANEDEGGEYLEQWRFPRVSLPNKSENAPPPPSTARGATKREDASKVNNIL
jgi:hypothetical protein